MKRVLIASGTSENKMKFAVATIEEYLQSKGITDVDVSAKNVYTMNLAAIDPDVIVLIGPRTFETSKPVIDGRAFITKIDAMVQGACEEIAAHIRIPEDSP